MIYFITDGEYLKIGFTESNIEARIANLQVGNARKLKLVGLIDGGRESETVLHRVFYELNVGGEWFLYDFKNAWASQEHEENGNLSNLEEEEWSERDLAGLNSLRKKIVYTMIEHPGMSITEVARQCETSRPTVTKMRKMFKSLIENHTYTLTEKQANEYALIMGRAVYDLSGHLNERGMNDDNDLDAN